LCRKKTWTDNRKKKVLTKKTASNLLSEEEEHISYPGSYNKKTTISNRGDHRAELETHLTQKGKGGLKSAERDGKKDVLNKGQKRRR